MGSLHLQRDASERMMGSFKTVIIKDYTKNILDVVTKVEDGDIAFIIDDDLGTIHIWNGQRTSMLNRYKAGMMAPALKSAFHLYDYKTDTVEQGNESERLKEEVAKLLDGKGSGARGEEKALIETAILEFQNRMREQPVSDAGESVLENKHLQEKPPSHGGIDKLKSELDAIKRDSESKSNELNTVRAELEDEKKRVLDLERDLESKTAIMKLEKEKLIAERDVATTRVERIKEGLDDKVKYLELEIQKLAGERDAVQRLLDDTRHYLEGQITLIKADRDAIKEEASRLENEKRDLENEMGERIRKIKEGIADKVKMNFYSIKQIPAAPTGSIWFESIVQVISGDKAAFPANIDAAKLKEMEGKQKRESPKAETMKADRSPSQQASKDVPAAKIVVPVASPELELPDTSNQENLEFPLLDEIEGTLAVQAKAKEKPPKEDEKTTGKDDFEILEAPVGKEKVLTPPSDGASAKVKQDTDARSQEGKEKPQEGKARLESDDLPAGDILDFASLDEIEDKLRGKKKGEHGQDGLNFD